MIFVAHRADPIAFRSSEEDRPKYNFVYLKKIICSYAALVKAPFHISKAKTKGALTQKDDAVAIWYSFGGNRTIPLVVEDIKGPE